MRKILLLTVVLLATTCFADSFKIEGTLTSPVTGNPVGTFAGMIEIDTATGSIVGWYIPMPSIPAGFGEPGMEGFTFTPSPVSSTCYCSQGGLEWRNPHGDRVLELGIPNKTLIGFTESAFSGDYGDPRDRFGADYFVSGTIASGTIATPEPSSLLLLGSGMAGIFAFRRKLLGVLSSIAVVEY